ncbi:MAG: two-component regulator propeller domain-containing protein [Ignavibacteriaceae bacterium]
MKKITVILFAYLFNSLIFPQSLGGWQTFTEMKDVEAIQATANGFWAASTGGAFFYYKDDQSFKTLRKSNGLNGTLLTSTTIDNKGNIWFGSQEGIIDIYNPENNSIQSLLDIYNSNKNPKQINELVTIGDTIIASTDFGITLIDPEKLILYDTFFRFGSFPTNIKVNSTLKSGKIYAATDYGVAIQKDGAVNLSAPESWSVYKTTDGLPSNKVEKIVNYKGAIVAATDSGLSYFDGSKWSSYIPQFDNLKVTDLLVANDTLFIVNNNVVYSYYNGNVKTYLTPSAQITKISYSNGLGLLAGSISSGVINGKSNIELFPNGPEANQFLGIDIDESGNLWCASGANISGIGFYKYDGQKWTNYNVSNTPQIQNNSYFVVKSFGTNILFGNWGHGFLSISGDAYKIFNVNNTEMKGIQTNPDYLVITDFEKDSKGNLWILNYGASDRKILSMVTPDSTWFYFSIPAFYNQYIQDNMGMAIDQYDTKWFYSQSDNKPGLFYFNENGTYSDPKDDISGYINKSNGLNDNAVNSILVDKRGDIWVGTGLGVNIISNNGSVLSSKPSLSITSVFTLRQQTINCMAVDPINQKWIGTNQGLLLVNSDGTNLIASYDSKNSPLPSDIIRSITIDDNSGKVYVATDAAITSFNTAAIKPQDSFTNLFVYPSPFILDGGNNNQVTISGLVVDSDIKILTITGKLVSEFSSPGGNVAFWDGKDMNGNYVSSGIYLVIAFDKEGNNAVAGKIAVIRK